MSDENECESKMSVPVKACARHYGNSFTKTFVYFSPHVLSFTIFTIRRSKNFHISCRCVCARNRSRESLFSISEKEKKIPHNSVCIGTSKLSVVELVNTRSSSIFLHFFTDIFFSILILHFLIVKKQSITSKKVSIN